MTRKPLLTLLFAVLSLQLLAIPARRGVTTVKQPDGTTLQICMEGDEWSRITRTVDGAALVQDAQGYWCYAWFDAAGARHSSGVRAGGPNAGSAAAAAAHLIPRNLIKARTAKARAGAARAQSEALRRVTSPATKAGGRKEKALIIIAQFPDFKLKYTRENFVSMLTKPGYYYNGATGSALDYFNDQFGGTVDFEFVVGPVVTLSKSFKYYGQNDEEGDDMHAVDAVVEACRLADASVDFSQFDMDMDGYVDNVFVFVAGPDEAEHAGDDFIWSHMWTLEEAGQRLTLDGKKIDTYAISTELSSAQDGAQSFTTIGTFCHEYSHCLGLHDLYDTDYEDSGGQASAVWWSTSLMDGGGYNNGGNTPPNYNAFELSTFSLGRCDRLEVGEFTLKPLGEEKRYFKADTNKDGEYFLFENRATSGWDKYIGGSGMLIYHVDESDQDAGYSDYYQCNLTAAERWENNEVNANPAHQCCYIVPALPLAQDVSQVFWPSGTHTGFTQVTDPAFLSWSGGTPEVSVIDIHRTDGGMAFLGAGPLAYERVEEFQDAAIVLWAATEGTRSCISITDPSGRKTEHVLDPYEPGRYSYTFEGLKEKTTYKVSIYSQSDPSVKLTKEFTTKAYYRDGYPFIYLNSAIRNSDGSFEVGTRIPLRVFNAPNAANVMWYFSNSTLTTDGSGYYTVRGSGTIQAVIDYRDGTREIISKTITAR